MDQTCLEAACAGGEPGQIYLIGILHILPDPTEDLGSDVYELRLGDGSSRMEPVIQARNHFNYSSWFTCVVRDPAGTLYVGEDDGYIRHADGKSVAVNLSREAKVKGALRCAYVRGVDDVVFGSYNGEIVHVHNGEVTVQQVGTNRFEHITACLNRIHGIGHDFMVVVGDGGNMGCYRNGRWKRVRPPANVRLDAVWCRNETEIYVGGWDEKAWRWNGADRWEPLTGEFPRHEGPTVNSQGFHDFAEFQGKLYAATSSQGIQRLEGDRFVPVPKVKQEYVGRLFATNIGLVGLGGVWGDSGSWLTLYDGERWRATQVKLKRIS